MEHAIRTESVTNIQWKRGVAAGVLAVVLTCVASGQTIIAPNVTYDGTDFDILDGVCDADMAMAGPQCTLRAALQNANQIGGAVTIPLGGTVYSLSVGGTDDIGRWGDLDVFSSTLTTLTITGVVNSTVIDAGPLATAGFPDRVLHVTSAVSASAMIEVRDVILRGGRIGGGKGGGIWHQSGRLLLTRCSIFDNQGTDGGGLRIDSELSMSGGSIQACATVGGSVGGGAFVQWSGLPVAQFSNVTFAGNSAQKGGAIRIASGAAAAIDGSTFSGNNTSNSGGAIDTSGSCSVTGSLFSTNTGTSGGAVNVAAGGTLTALRATFNSNSAQFGGAVNVAGLGTADLTETTIDHNLASLNGGGLANSGSAQLTRCTVSRNDSVGGNGGGIHSFGQITVDQSTISNNRAPSGSGGGHSALGGAPQMFSACTIAMNMAGAAGGGIYSDNVLAPPLIGLSSVLVADNRAGPLPQNFAGAVPLGSFGSNVDTDGTCVLVTASDQSGTVGMPLDARIGPLQLNGGPTETHALLFCSPAIDHGSSTTIAGLVLSGDQRHMPYLGAPDTGAYEYQIPFQQVTPYCFGTALACPCGAGAPGHGCPSGVNPSGGLLGVTGSPSVSNPTVVLHGSGMTNSFVLYFQGTQQVNGGLGAPFGDGLRCVAGTVIRLGLVQNVGGASSWPPAPMGWVAQVPALTAGDVRNYQGWYRDASGFCTNATFNLTNALQLLWCP